MPELLRDILQTPTPTLLIVFGLFFLGIAVVGRISGKIDPGRTGRIVSGSVGVCLLAIGLIMQTNKSDEKKGSQGDGSIPPDSSGVFDLTTNAPSAIRTINSGATFLRWGGSDADPQGFALNRNNAFLEDGSQTDRVLETHPQWISNGHIWGDYNLPEPIRAGDRFRAMVGFLQGSAGEAEFVVEAFGGTLPMSVVTKVSDKGYDKALRTIDADLTPMAGATTIRLIVEAGPSFGQDWAVWINPRLERAGHSK